MTANPPTLINLPPPPSDPATPNDVPGTPNSATTTMSELSTVAIKDGHRGHFPHHHHPGDVERADRISRLAGLERVAVSGRTPQGFGPGAASNPPPGYFDANNQPQIFRERSTVGSASATGSVGGRTTWASGSDVNDPDRMSEDQDADNSSVGGFSDEAASLVGFGEGARTPARQHSQLGSPAVAKASAVPTYLREQAPGSLMAGASVPSSSESTQTASSVDQQKQDAQGMDDTSYDEAVTDTTNRTPPLTGNGPGGASTAEQVIRERMRQRQATQAA
ncbi:hypothetical protein BU23DRAFT_414709, partial [Bimuria novae-zelandiae CBS 107.79]